MEYATGGDPAIGSPLRRGSTDKRAGIQLVQDSGQVKAVLWHPSDVTGISYTLEKSVDLVDWTSLSAGSECNEDGGKVITWANVNGTDLSGFVRLKVVLDGTDSVSFGVPMGWNTVSFRSLESTTYPSDGMQTYGPTLLPAAFYAGTVASVTGSSVTVRGGGADDLRVLWPANARAYIEFTEGPAEGHQIEVSREDSTAHTLALLLSSPMNSAHSYPEATAGTRFVLRTLSTLDLLFPKDLFQGSNSIGGADYFVRSVDGIFYSLMDIPETGRRWVISQNAGTLLPFNASRADQGNQELAPGDGFVVTRRLGAAALSYLEIGELRPWHQRWLLKTDYSYHAGAYPFDQSPHDLGLGAPAGLLVSDLPYFSVWRRDVDISALSYQWELCALGPSDQWQGIMLGSGSRDVTNLPVFYRSRAHGFASRNREVAAPIAVPWPSTAHMLPSNPFRDTDEDGVSDNDEIVAGTDPNDFFNGEAPTLGIVSGDGARTATNHWTTAPLVVQVLHHDGTTAWPHAPVTFSSTAVKVGTAATGAGAGSVVARTGSDGQASAFALMPMTSGSHLGVTAAIGGASTTFYLDVGNTPTISFVTPNPAIFTTALASITFTLNVSDFDNDAVTVTLLDRQIELGHATATNTSSGTAVDITWTAPAGGHHVVLAKADDGTGRTAWAALIVEVPSGSANQALGPVEGGMHFAINGTSDDLRSNPFVLKPVFAGRVGAVSGSTLSFTEMPGWEPGAFKAGYFVYVRSGTALGAVLEVADNDSYSLTLTSSTPSLAQGNLIALIPKWSLDVMLPADALPSTSSAYLAAARNTPPSATRYHRDGEGLWHSDDNPASLTDIYVQPWSTFSMVHGTPGATTFMPFGDVAAGPVRTTFDSQSGTYSFAPVAPQGMSLIASGLKDGIVIGDTDSVITWNPDSTEQEWRFSEGSWLAFPTATSPTGEDQTLLPGGAVIVHRATSGASKTWLQPAGK